VPGLRVLRLRVAALLVVGLTILPTASFALPAGGAAAAAVHARPTGAAVLPDAGLEVVSRPSVASWPLYPEPAVLRSFQPPAQRWSPGHRGVDLAASAGQAVLAPAPGTVTFAGVVVDRGVLTVTHPGGLRSSFEPVTSQVPVGTVVSQGAVIALVDPSVAHCAPATCLHWGVRRGDVYLDPLRMLAPPPPSVLLPLRGTGPAGVGGGLGHRRVAQTQAVRNGQGGPAAPQANLAEPVGSPVRAQAGRARPQAGQARPQAGQARPQAGQARPQAGQARPQAGQARPQVGQARAR
jgi:hypothetical protein